MDSGLCCLRYHATTPVPWTRPCPCPCHTRTEESDEGSAAIQLEEAVARAIDKARDTLPVERIKAVLERQLRQQGFSARVM